MLTRRTALRIGLGLPFGFAAVPAWAASKDFWDTKQPADWTSREIQQLLTRSPWARETSVSYNSGQTVTNNRGGMGGNRGGMGGGGIGGGIGGGVGGGIGGPLGGGRVGGGGGGMGGGGTGRDGGMGGDGGVGGGGNDGPGGGRRDQYQFLLRWDSALPIREALHAEPSDDVASSYIVNLIGDLPGMGGRGSRNGDDDDDDQHRLEMLKEYTKLDRKDHPIYLTKAEPSSNGMLFYFPRSEPISMDDRQITFATSLKNRTGLVDVRVKFNLKDMMYRGKLEL